VVTRGAPHALIFRTMTSGYSIRSATRADAPQIAEIYATYVRETPASFEIDPPTADEMMARLEAGTGSYPWLVAEEGKTLIAYAYGSAFRTRPAYRWSVEVSVYVHKERRGGGVGRAVMSRLLDELRERGFANAFAGTTLPNPASVRLFESLGFEPIGVFRNVGYKFEAWHDVGWWQLPLREFASG